MNKKMMIAHELGHAISSSLLDNQYVVDNIKLESDDDSCHAYCDFHIMKLDNKSYRNIKDMSDLGGIIGELLYCGKAQLWWSRGDFDNFLTSNYYSKSKLVDDIDELFNKGEYFDKIRKMNRKHRYNDESSITISQIKNEYENLYSAYRRVEKVVNKRVFRQTVENIYYDNIKNISAKEYYNLEEDFLK